MDTRQVLDILMFIWVASFISLCVSITVIKMALSTRVEERAAVVAAVSMLVAMACGLVASGITMQRMYP